VTGCSESRADCRWWLVEESLLKFECQHGGVRVLDIPAEPDAIRNALTHELANGTWRT
jgi:hypothetical protein